MKTYRAQVLARHGGPDQLQVLNLPLAEPGPGELRVRVLAAGLGATDLMMLAGRYAYAPPLPFVPGYEVVGRIDAIGPGVQGFVAGQRVAALVVHGGFGEYLVRDAWHFVPVPDGVPDETAAATVLNHVSAWQMAHRVARVTPGRVALVTGAAGGVGSALLQVLRLAGLRCYGAASVSKHETIRRIGAQAIDSRAGPVDEQLLALEPQGADYVFDAIGLGNLGPCVRALRRGGLLVGFGFMGSQGRWDLLRYFPALLLGPLLRGRRGRFYGITRDYRRQPGPVLEDMGTVLAMAASGLLGPAALRIYPFEDAAEALTHLASGQVSGKLVLRVS